MQFSISGLGLAVVPPTTLSEPSGCRAMDDHGKHGKPRNTISQSVTCQNPRLFIPFFFLPLFFYIFFFIFFFFFKLFSLRGGRGFPDSLVPRYPTRREREVRLRRRQCMERMHCPGCLSVLFGKAWKHRPSLVPTPCMRAGFRHFVGCAGLGCAAGGNRAFLSGCLLEGGGGLGVRFWGLLVPLLSCIAWSVGWAYHRRGWNHGTGRLGRDSFVGSGTCQRVSGPCNLPGVGEGAEGLAMWQCSAKQPAKKDKKKSGTAISGPGRSTITLLSMALAHTVAARPRCW